MTEKMYVRIPQYTDNEGTFVRLFAEGGKIIELPDNVLSLLNKSAVLRVTNQELEIKLRDTTERLKIKLPNRFSQKWIMQR